MVIIININVNYHEDQINVMNIEKLNCGITQCTTYLVKYSSKECAQKKKKTGLTLFAIKCIFRTYHNTHNDMWL